MRYNKEEVKMKQIVCFLFGVACGWLLWNKK